MLLAGTGLPDGVAAAERLRAAIEATRLPEAPGLPITASFGVAVLKAGMERPEDWIEAADRALYRAKVAGRNRVEAA